MACNFSEMFALDDNGLQEQGFEPWFNTNFIIVTVLKMFLK